MPGIIRIFIKVYPALNLNMKIEHHITLSTVISGALYAIFESWELSISSLIAGILIDIDHTIDYCIECGLRFDRNEFLSYFYNEKHQKITLFLHGWEWLFCLGVATVFAEFNPWVTGMLIGYAHHMVFDYFYSRTSILTYSLVWRWRKNFNSQTLFPRDRGYNPKV